MTAKLTCAWCEETLAEEQSAYPEKSTDGEVLCDECYGEEYRDECHRCDNTVDKSELESRPGEIVAFLRTATGLSSDVVPGYYRVKEWPIFADGITEGYIFDMHLERIGDLDPAALRIGDGTTACGIPLCSDCQQRVTRSAA